jgi:hypothetical protein
MWGALSDERPEFSEKLQDITSQKFLIFMTALMKYEGILF